MQRIPESSCARKETVDIDILVSTHSINKGPTVTLQKSENWFFVISLYKPSEYPPKITES